jgi:alpha-beta hydrolase superfamily lysophospholipase
MKPISKISFSSLFARRSFKALAVGALLLGLCGPAMAQVTARIDGDSFRAPDGTALPLRNWLPAGKPAALILALHGFGDYSAAFRTPAEFWAKAGIATFAYDQRGFGGAPHTFHWAGTPAMEGDARAAVATLRQLYPGVPVYLMGESMGGALALAATTGPDAIDVDGAILVSPAIWEHDFLGSMERSALWLANLTAPGLWLEPPRGLKILPSNNIDMLRALARDSLVQKGARADTTAGLMDLMDRAGSATAGIRLPTLVLFGAQEQVLPRTAVEDFISRLPAANVRLAVYPDGYHMLLRDLDGEIVWKDILAWVENHAAALPSGDECSAHPAIAKPCRLGPDK